MFRVVGVMLGRAGGFDWCRLPCLAPVAPPVEDCSTRAVFHHRLGVPHEVNSTVFARTVPHRHDASSSRTRVEVVFCCCQECCSTAPPEAALSRRRSCWAGLIYSRSQSQGEPTGCSSSPPQESKMTTNWRRGPAELKRWCTLEKSLLPDKRWKGRLWRQGRSNSQCVERSDQTTTPPTDAAPQGVVEPQNRRSSIWMSLGSVEI